VVHRELDPGCLKPSMSLGLTSVRRAIFVERPHHHLLFFQRRGLNWRGCRRFRSAPLKKLDDAWSWFYKYATPLGFGKRAGDGC
jgi:hypothetical protein